MNIALFGGTFDPIHYGHLAVARAARRQLMLEEILFVPSGVPPHKRAGAVTPFHDRHAMVVLATAGERSFVPSRLEDPDLVAGATYSIDTVRRVRRALGPSDRLFFLIGATRSSTSRRGAARTSSPARWNSSWQAAPDSR
jgi:nicotinate-nucleotide adenylyltransferase